MLGSKGKVVIENEEIFMRLMSDNTNAIHSIARSVERLVTTVAHMSHTLETLAMILSERNDEGGVDFSPDFEI
jgi:hypothetical protein